MTAADDLPAMPVVREPLTKRWSRELATVPGGHLVLAGALLLFFAIFLVWPILNVVGEGFRSPTGGFSIDYLKLVLTDAALLKGLWNAAVIAVATTFVSLAIALPLAILSVKFDFAGKTLLGGLLLVPLVLPPFVGAVGLKTVLGTFGPLTTFVGYFGVDTSLGIDWLGKYRFAGVVLVEALHLYPILLLNVQAALANVDPAMEQAARNLGASRLTVFRRITLPLIRPGLFAGCTLVLIWSFTELGTPLVFNYREVTPVQIFERLTEAQGNPVPYALVVVMLAASVLLYAIGKIVLGRGFDAATTKAGVVATPIKLRGLKAALAALPFLFVFGLAVVPHIAVITTSVTQTGQWYQSIWPTGLTGSHYEAALSSDLVMSSVRNSLIFASAATLVAIVVGLGVGVIVVRSRVPGRGFIDALAMLPLAVPGLVLAFGYLSISFTFVRWFPEQTGPDGWLSWLNVLENPAILLIIAYAARRLPYVARAAVAGLQQTPRDLELAASNLGASKWRVLSKITMPLIIANLIAGGLLAFSFAMLEVSDSLILAQRAGYYPITKAIYELVGRLGDGLYVASALGVWTMVLLTLTILSANALLAKKMGAIFRM
ncbi:MAG: iron ABC transporter permease [Planctomycetota bacterium]